MLLGAEINWGQGIISAVSQEDITVTSVVSFGTLIPFSTGVTSINGNSGIVELNYLDVGAATAAQGAKADSALQPSDVSTAGKTGSYTDLTNKPTIPGLPTLATVATSGSYNDLSDKPSVIQGEKGDTGLTGAKGDTGAAGLNGINGAKGDKGDKGDTGLRGEKGDQGIQGEKGDTGGGSSTVSDYSITALASAWTGTNPSVLALAVTGLLATHKTVLDVDLSSETFANIGSVQADYALIYRAVPTSDTLTLYASKKPFSDLSLKLVVLNG